MSTVVTPESLKAEIDALLKQREQKVTEICSIDGAVQAFRYILEKLEHPVESADAGEVKQ